MVDQARLMILLDAYQRGSAQALARAKVAHDVAFKVTSSLDDHIAVSIEAMTALQQAQLALAAVRDFVAHPDPDVPLGPEMATPLVLPA